MNSRHQEAANKIIVWTFHRLVQAWPRSSRDWAVAMQSELSEIHNPQESFRWLTGGIMSLGKAWWNHVIYGWNENEKEPSAARTPGPLAIALAVAALVAFFMMPSVHEGFSAVIGAWPHNNTREVANYQRMAREAEANHDAKTLAFLSSRMNSLDEDVRLKIEAVQMDPSLTWIYTRGADSRCVGGNGKSPRKARRGCKDSEASGSGRMLCRTLRQQVFAARKSSIRKQLPGIEGEAAGRSRMAFRHGQGIRRAAIRFLL